MALYLRKPIIGVRPGCRVDCFTCRPLAAGDAAPTDAMVDFFHDAVVDRAERQVSVDELRRYDLEASLADALATGGL